DADSGISITLANQQLARVALVWLACGQANLAIGGVVLIDRMTHDATAALSSPTFASASVRASRQATRARISSVTMASVARICRTRSSTAASGIAPKPITAGCSPHVRQLATYPDAPPNEEYSTRETSQPRGPCHVTGSNESPAQVSHAGLTTPPRFCRSRPSAA